MSIMKCNKDIYKHKSRYNANISKTNYYIFLKDNCDNKCNCKSKCKSKYNCKCENRCKSRNKCKDNCNSKHYKIINDTFFLDPKASYCSDKGILMYDQNMVWNAGFKSIAPFLLYGPNFLNVVCQPYSAQNVRTTPAIMPGKPLFDSLNDITYLVFTFNGDGPVANDPNFHALLINMYDNAPDFIFSYTIVPVDPTEPVSVSFYTITNIYEFDTEGFWLMLDRDSHFTTYAGLSHTFQIPGIVTWMATGENIASINLTVTAVAELITPTCAPDFLTAIVNVDHQKQKVVIGNIIATADANMIKRCHKRSTTITPIPPVDDVLLTPSAGSVILTYCPDLQYSVDRMLNYIKANSLGLLLPIVPVNLDIPAVLPIIPEFTPNTAFDTRTYVGWSNNLIPATGLWSVSDNITLKSGPGLTTTLQLTDGANGDSIAWHNNIATAHYYGVVTTAYTDKYSYVQLSWDITFTPSAGITVPGLGIYYDNKGIAYRHTEVFKTFGGSIRTRPADYYADAPGQTAASVLKRTIYLQSDCTDVIFYFHQGLNNGVNVKTSTYTINSVSVAGWIGDPPPTN